MQSLVDGKNKRLTAIFVRHRDTDSLGNLITDAPSRHRCSTTRSSDYEMARVNKRVNNSCLDKTGDHTLPVPYTFGELLRAIASKARYYARVTYAPLCLSVICVTRQQLLACPTKFCPLKILRCTARGRTNLNMLEFVEHYTLGVLRKSKEAERNRVRETRQIFVHFQTTQLPTFFILHAFCASSCLQLCTDV